MSAQQQREEQLIEQLEQIPGCMVLLPTPGTSGRRLTTVRISLRQLHKLLAQTRTDAIGACQQVAGMQQERLFGTTLNQMCIGASNNLRTDLHTEFEQLKANGQKEKI